MCPLCELKTILHIYDESDPRWITMDCMTCILPMSVWRGEPQHTMSISEKDAIEMEEALSKIGEEKFGKGKFFIDKVQREVLDHLHWHARPIEGNEKILKETQ
ncbi:MAG TPA: hypothetical protein EYG21_03220 [Nitrospinaceae bacterium]|jgi:hypothetical protein|nr:hypothetical protein [Nitrospinaceae bacterium]